MESYESLYKNGPKETDIAQIKKDFSEDPGLTSWEEYYWASKCIVEYDMDDFEPKFMSRMLNNSLKYGLTYRINKEYYLDVIKMLASVYALMGRYELVLNCLNAVIELDHDVPDWVFHDLVSAQNRAGYIKKNLKRPAMFLSDLAHNDGNNPETKKKQENIFKEFLAAGIVYITENPDAIVDLTSIEDAAKEYGLINTREWKTFADACNGKVSEPIKTRAEKIVKEETPVKSRPLVISLFPEDDVDAVKQALSDSEQKLKNAAEQIQKTAVENKALKEELAKVKAKDDNQVFSSNQSAVIIGKWKTFEVITTQKLAKWLTKNLSYFTDWWDRCVMGVLKPDQVLKAQDGHYATLQEFDLAALLRIFVKNWQRLGQCNFLTESDRETVVAMFDVRNNLAHSNVAPLNKEAIVGDLATMSVFLGLINSNTEAKEVAKYAKEVASMELG